MARAGAESTNRGAMAMAQRARGNPPEFATDRSPHAAPRGRIATQVFLPRITVEGSIGRSGVLRRGAVVRFLGDGAAAVRRRAHRSRDGSGLRPGRASFAVAAPGRPTASGAARLQGPAQAGVLARPSTKNAKTAK